MEKHTYLDIQKRLDFRVRTSTLLAHAAQDAALLGASAFLLRAHAPLAWAAAQGLLACFFFRSFSLMHEAVHRAVSRRPWLNNGLGVLYGGFCFLPFTSWQAMHQEHHHWVGNFEKDPVMKMVRGFPGKSEAAKNVDTLLWRSWIPYIAFLQEAVFWSVSATFLFEGRFRDRRIELVASLLAPLAAAAAVLGAGLLLGHWALLLPSVALYLAMVEIINLPHHLCLPRLPGEGRLHLWNQYKVSRTCVYGRWFSRFVLLNFNYHAEHHMFPTLPWHQLDKAHALVREAQPEGYQLCVGHAWIRENRGRNLRDVFAPTQALRPDRSEAGEAA